MTNNEQRKTCHYTDSISIEFVGDLSDRLMLLFEHVCDRLRRRSFLTKISKEKGEKVFFVSLSKTLLYFGHVVIEENLLEVFVYNLVLW